MLPLTLAHSNPALATVPTFALQPDLPMRESPASGAIRTRPSEPSRKAFARHIHDPAAMARLVRYERSRAERSGVGFSVLLIESRDGDDAPALLSQVLRYLSQRLRTIDELGWLDDERIGALLPYTPAAGAWKVADDVVAALEDVDAPPLLKVLTYPDSSSVDDDLAPWSDDHHGGIAGNPRVSSDLSEFFTRPLPWWKRLIDLIGAGTGLLLLSPLLLAVAVMIKCVSRGPVFFFQDRTGVAGKRFRMVKFRTMVPNAEAKRDSLLAMNEQDGPAFKIKRDPRVTAWGRVLRATSIDELPQLWNVLRGEMSLVGPRPLPCKEADGCQPWQRRRLDVSPGLTCYWQVSGRSSVSFDQWMRMDLQYVDERSWWNDIKLILSTIPAVLSRRGAS